jgi:hypothetical protein
MINTITKFYDSITKDFSGYKITYINSNIVSLVPLNPDNTDYQAIQEWIEDGGKVIDNPPTE